MNDAIAPTTAWADRWNEPTAEALMAELNEPATIHMPKLLSNVEGEVPSLKQRVIWHGTSWRWTLEYSAESIITTAGGEGREVLFYFVPNPEEPLVCVPLRPEVLEHLPIRRLNRYIRDGIKSAKWAVDIRWGKWIVTANTEVEHMTDLLKRKAKIFVEESVSQKRSKKAG